MFKEYKPFMPETTIEGRRGFYPCRKDEWRNLPLPLRCATWYRSDIESVIFDVWLNNCDIRANVEVHPKHVFKALFTLPHGGANLHSVVGVRLMNGKRLCAKWLQDTTSGAFAIFCNGGGLIAKQGGYQCHMPENCIEKDGEWQLNAGRISEPITRYHLV